MTFTKRQPTHKGVWNAAIACFFQLLFVLPGAQEAVVQVDPYKIEPFIGTWSRDQAQDRGNCGGYPGDDGGPLYNCQLPADQLPLNERGKAWLKFFDLHQSPGLNDCMPQSIPSQFGDNNPWQFSAQIDKIIQFFGDAGGWTRDIWMDGRTQRPPAETLFQSGYAIGHWDGEDLIVVSTNYVFNQEGIDDHLHMASSVRKKVTERYHHVDPETLRVTITLEDPIFLTRPFTYAHMHKKRAGRPAYQLV